MPETHATRVTVPGGAYDVLVGRGLLDGLGAAVRQRSGAVLCALVTDDVVGPLFASRAEASLRAGGIEPITMWVHAGERSKSWSEAGRLLEEFSESGLGRDALVVALGGGVVGDLAGFVAATYLRGVPVVQVPTTLLAQVDSAIGGKTGVDLPRGKNLAGAFWQPALVLADTACLDTLPDPEWRSGLAEVVKSAALDGEAAFAALEASAGALARREEAAVLSAVMMAAGFKARVVSGDEREAADREALNYGHTLAHALERELGYGNVTHGAAVAEGLRFAARLAVSAVGAPVEWAQRQERLLDALGLAAMGGECDAGMLLAAMRSDKKARAGQMRLVLSTAPGEWRVEPVDERMLGDALERWCDDNEGDVR
jgi:3-dehydroquinate synthase